MSNYKTVYIPCTYKKAKALGVEFETAKVDDETLKKNLEFSLNEENSNGYSLVSTTPIIGTSSQGAVQTHGIQLIYKKQ